MAVREWDTAFFDDEPVTVTHDDANSTFDWPGGGPVLWAATAEGESLLNELNPRLAGNGPLRQPEVIPKSSDAKDRVAWSLFVPSAVLAADLSGKASVLPLTVLMGRANEDVGYGLRIFFERAGTGALLCLTGREVGDTGGRWNVGVSQATIEKLIANAGLLGTPEVQVLAGYSTGYGVVQTINNELVPLAPVKRLVLFDCLYRTDKPPLPHGEPRPTLTTKDQPEFRAGPGQQVMDEQGDHFQQTPFNMRRAITRLQQANGSVVIAGYSSTGGGSPRYGIYGPPPGEKLPRPVLRNGTRPVVEIPNLIELRTLTAPTGSKWSPSEALDMLLLCRLLDLGTKASLIDATDIPVPHQEAITSGLPVRGTVVATDVSQKAATPTTNLPAAPMALLDWVNRLKKKPSGKESAAAALLVQQHKLTLPGWDYAANDLLEYRHAGVLSEFGWEFLPP